MKIEQEFDEKYSQQEKNYEKKYSEKKNKNQEQDVLMNFARYDDHENELYYEEVIINSKEKYEIFANFVRIEAFCFQCKKVFPFKNKLHKHLKTECKEKSMNKSLVKNKSFEKNKISRTKSKKSIIIKFIAFKIDKSYDLTFKE